MIDLIFVLALGAALAALLGWAFRTLPRDGWQIMATVPQRRQHSGAWVGANLTYYGLITASAGTAAIAVFLVLMAAVHAPPSTGLALVAAVIACCLPASKLVARVVERKQHTSTVAGAVFIGLLVAPLAIAAINAGASAPRAPLAPAMAAIAVAYVIGEGLGRLACISFGCCYGKPVAHLGPRARRLFERFHFAFQGETRKIAYASGLEGIKVVPIQAITATLYVGIGLAGMLAFLQSRYRLAYALTILVSQVWRLCSEALRADHRGGGRISAYQKMTVIGIAYSLALLAALPQGGPPADLLAGLAAMWNPLVIVALQLLWSIMFLATGWSAVTGSLLSFHVHRDRI